MRTLKIKLTGTGSKIIPKIVVDERAVNLKKNEFGSYETTVKTEKQEVDIFLYRELELKSKLWWLYAIISFIVSIFGIFELPYDRKCIIIDCHFKVSLNEANEIKFKLNSLSPQGKAVNIETNCDYSEITNELKIDKNAKLRCRILLIIKIIVWIGIAITFGYLISKAL